MAEDRDPKAEGYCILGSGKEGLVTLGSEMERNNLC